MRFGRIPEFAFLLGLAVSEAAYLHGTPVWNSADLLEAKLLYGFGNGMQGRALEDLRESAGLAAARGGARRQGLEKLYQSGLDHQKGNRLGAAESCFLEVLASDPGDWEAREGLARVYQALGQREKRDSALSELRRMHSTGEAWGQTICRDVFILAGKTIRAYEIPSFEFPERRRILFSIQDSAGGATRFLAAVSRMERQIRTTGNSPSPLQDQHVPGFQISFVTERQRRVYFVAYHKPGYSTMKKMLANYLSEG